MASSARPIAAVPNTDDRPENDPLRRVQRGELSLDAYLDERAERALDHVRGTVTDEVLAVVRETVREQLRSDPVLVELVRQATGSTSNGTMPLPKTNGARRKGSQ